MVWKVRMIVITMVNPIISILTAITMGLPIMQKLA